MRLSTPLWTQWKLLRYIKKNPTHITWQGECPCGCGRWAIDTIRFGKINMTATTYRLLERNL